jgi:opine dehydrogenase
MTKSAGAADLNSAKRWPEGRVYRKYASNTASDIGNKGENSFAKGKLREIEVEVKEKVTIIGIGNGGHALAFHLALLGHPVMAYMSPKFAEALPGLKQKGGIEATDWIDSQGKTIEGVLKGFAKLEEVSTDIKQAMDFADVVFIVVPSFAQADIFQLMIPHLRDEHIITMMPGNFGSLLLKNQLEKQKVLKKVAIAETNSIMHAARQLETEGGRVLITGLKKKLTVGVLPTRRTYEVTSRLQSILPLKVEATETVLETAFTNMNMIVHPGTVVLNTGRYSEKPFKNFKFYKEGISKEVGGILDEMDKERCAVAKGLGCKFTPTFIELTKMCYGKKYNNIYEFAQKSPVHQDIIAPDTINSRYLTEDVPHLLVPVYLLGKSVGVDCPAIESVIRLASIITGNNYLEVGRTLRDMGLEGLTPKQIMTKIKGEAIRYPCQWKQMAAFFGPGPEEEEFGEEAFFYSVPNIIPNSR